LPLPRIDLLKVDRYMLGSTQISRGCPFTCEFCDIIVTFDRKRARIGASKSWPRSRPSGAPGFRIVSTVDDNLIGNKKAACRPRSCATGS
jgi:hypothetical protein